jgi:hypothetical protein
MDCSLRRPDVQHGGDRPDGDRPDLHVLSRRNGHREPGRDEREDRERQDALGSGIANLTVQRVSASDASVAGTVGIVLK